MNINSDCESRLAASTKCEAEVTARLRNAPDVRAVALNGTEQKHAAFVEILRAIESLAALFVS
jgi:hypothetical protein